jgi:hypothetical protein
MSLQDRLKRIEKRLDALEQAHHVLVDALEEEAQAEEEEQDSPALDLDGQGFGGERDQTQAL